MPWILDGNNLAGGRDRGTVREAALTLARVERIRIVVVFDGPPPEGAPVVEHLGGVEVRYTPNADRAIAEQVKGHVRNWRVATDDRELADRLRGLGVKVFPADHFWRRLRAGEGGALRSPGQVPGDGGGIRRQGRVAGQRQGSASEPTSPAVDVEEELSFFSDPGARLGEGGAVRIPRRRTRRSR